MTNEQTPFVGKVGGTFVKGYFMGCSYKDGYLFWDEKTGQVVTAKPLEVICPGGIILVPDPEWAAKVEESWDQGDYQGIALMLGKVGVGLTAKPMIHPLDEGPKANEFAKEINIWMIPYAKAAEAEAKKKGAK